MYWGEGCLTLIVFASYISDLVYSSIKCRTYPARPLFFLSSNSLYLPCQHVTRNDGEVKKEKKERGRGIGKPRG